MQLLTIVCTVEKTGTHSLAGSFPHDLIYHCGDDAIEKAKEGHRILTTYRDPIRTAASWWNASPQMLWRHRNWIKQWGSWGEIIKLGAEVYPTESLSLHYNKGKDSTGLHKLLDDGDMEGFYRMVPKSDIDYALEIVNDLNHDHLAHWNT